MHNPTVQSVSSNFSVNFVVKNEIFRYCYSRYFSKTATQEILAEMFPKLSPLDTGRSCDAFGMLSLFLNTGNNYELWFFDCMELWDAYHNPPWNYVSVEELAVVVLQIVIFLYRNEILGYHEFGSDGG